MRISYTLNGKNYHKQQFCKKELNVKKQTSQLNNKNETIINSDIAKKELYVEEQTTQLINETIINSDIINENKFQCEDCGKEYTTLNGKNYHKNIYCKKEKQNETNILK